MQIMITINGVEYPCQLKMGALLRFKQIMGYDISKADMSDITVNLTYLWCCIVAACKSEGKEFNMSLEDFADSIDLSDMQGWQAALSEQIAKEAKGVNDEKKSQ